VLPALVAGALIWILVRWWKARGPAIRSALAARRRRREASEEAAFGRLRRACREGDPGPAYRALVAWLDRARIPEAASPQGLAATAGDPRLAEEVSKLESEVFGRPASGSSAAGTGWRGAQLERALARSRRRLRASRSAAPPVPEALPPLNP
jgi:hypothetical protein